MAVQSIGLPLQLQASTQQLQDLLGGLKPGDLLKGRLLEILPEGKAVLNLRGQNLVAQLPAGLNAAKGTVLPLQVTQLAPADAGKAASLTLRLLPTLAVQEAAVPSAAAGAPTQAQAVSTQAQVDQALSAARLPSTPVSQQVARTLVQLGVPLTPQALQSAVQAVNSLLAAETALPALGPAPSAPAALEPLQGALSQLRVAAQLSPPGPANLVLQQAVREVQAALQSAQAPSPQAAQTAPTVVPNLIAPSPSAPLSTAPVPAQQTPPASMPAAAAPMATPASSTPVPLAAPALPAPASGPAPAPATPTAPAAPLPAPASTVQPAAPTPSAAAANVSASATLQRAVTQLISQPGPVSLQSLQIALQAVVPAPQSPAPDRSQGPGPIAAPTAAPAPAPATTSLGIPAPAPATTGLGSPLPAQAARPAPLPPPASTIPAQPAAAVPVVLPLPVDAARALVQREAVAPLQALLMQAGPAPSVQVLQAALALQIQSLESPASAPAQRLLQAVQIQHPQAQSATVLQAGREALSQIQAQLAGLPPSQTLALPALQQLMDQAQVAAPRVPLQSLPMETVAEAVAWLQARDLPPQRPLVEAVAVFLQQDHNALPAAQRALAQAAALPAEILQQRPSLATAVRDAHQALDQATLRPETPDLAGRLGLWASQQGLDLESALARAEGRFSPPERAAEALPQAGLRPALQRLEHQLRLAQQDPQARPADLAPLQSALAETQNANRALSAVPLQVQGAPAYDTVHMPLPVMMGQDLGGRLSVTWRHGRDRQLDEKEPVSVAVALNTGSLGTVKVLLQVWKDAASARVVAEDPETADFLAEGADELKAGFAERTPFKLQALDFAAAAADSGQGLPEAPRGPAGADWSA